ncbi:MAG: hypothetical protein FWF22_08360 [Treponema sp.]|nr:hypothetical protein [Treponema sp.]
MTSRERLTRLFDGRETDRVPIWLLFPYHYFGSYTDVYANPYYRSILPYIDKYCDTFDRRGYPADHFCFNGNPDIIRETVTENINGVPTEISQIRYGSLCFKKYVETAASGKILRNYINDPQRLADIASIPYIFPEPDFSKIIKEREELGDRGLLMLDLGDPLIPLYHLVSAENFSIWSLTDYQAMLEFTDLMAKRSLAMYRACLEKNVGDVFFIVGTEFAGPPMVSPAKFNELCVRYVKGIVDLIRSYGKYSIVHYHGNLFHVLPGMKEINPDGLHTIEAPPVGDCTIAQARAALENMILIGNIQYDDFRSQPQEGIDSMVREAIKEARGGRFILSPTAGPYEESLTDHQVKNYIAFIEAGIKYGRQ